MQRQSASSPIELPIELEIGCIRELSRSGRHSEALAAAVTLAARAPQDRDVLYLIAANQRCVNRVHEALETLQRLAQYHPRFSLLHQERGYCYFTLRDAARAVDAFLRAVDINPALAASWSMLERLYRMAGDIRNTAAAAQRLTKLKHLPPEVVRAGSLFSDGDLSAAEDILRAFLLKSGDDVEALRLLARIQHKRDVLDDAESLLEAALKLAPNYLAARPDHVRVLIDGQKYLRMRRHRRTPAGDHAVSQAASRVVGGSRTARVARQFVEGCRTAEGSGRMLPDGGRRQTELWRCLVEPRQPQDLSLLRGRDRAHARQGNRAGHGPRRSLPSLLRARQGGRRPER